MYKKLFLFYIMSKKYKEKSKELSEIVKPINNEYKIKAKKFINGLRNDVHDAIEWENKFDKSNKKFSFERLHGGSAHLIDYHSDLLDPSNHKFDTLWDHDEFEEIFKLVLDVLYN